tara:strand:+ start:1229 stop:1678 length:450 start_codon:yes stop_codon:yes gene_type:complete
MDIIIKIFVLQFIFLIILSLTRLLTKKISIHLQNILNLLILFLIIIIYQNQINTVLLIKFYFSNAVIFTILLSTLERSVALGLLRKIYLKKEINIKDLEKSFNIETLIFQRLKNLQNNNLLKINDTNLYLTKSGSFLLNIIKYSIKTFK